MRFDQLSAADLLRLLSAILTRCSATLHGAQSLEQPPPSGAASESCLLGSCRSLGAAGERDRRDGEVNAPSSFKD